MSLVNTFPISNTPFDDTFKTILERMPFLMIPFINEVFGTDYRFDSKEIILEHTEHHTPKGKLVEDSVIRISSNTYRLECQSTPDSTISLRLIKYNFAGTLEDALASGKHEGTYHLTFSHSCVLYLRKKPRKIKQEPVILDFPDGTSKTLKIPAVYLQAYSLDEIRKKKLFLFLPFYFMRYEMEFHEEHTAKEELLKKLDHDFQVIEEYMYQAFHGTDRMYCYTLLNELISRILDVIIPSEGSLRKEVDKIMGGHSIATPTTIALDQGYAEGHRDGILQGIQQGIQQGVQQGVQQGTVTTIIDFIKDGLISIRQGAEKLQISEEEMRKLL